MVVFCLTFPHFKSKQIIIIIQPQKGLIVKVEVKHSHRVRFFLRPHKRHEEKSVHAPLSLHKIISKVFWSLFPGMGPTYKEWTYLICTRQHLHLVPCFSQQLNHSTEAHMQHSLILWITCIIYEMHVNHHGVSPRQLLRHLILADNQLLACVSFTLWWSQSYSKQQIKYLIPITFMIWKIIHGKFLSSPAAFLHLKRISLCATRSRNILSAVYLREEIPNINNFIRLGSLPDLVKKIRHSVHDFLWETRSS